MTICIMHSGRQIDAAMPQPGAIWLRDIGVHLAKLCKFNGGTHAFYSEAQHATLVAAEMARHEGPLAGLYGLLHDAPLAIETCRVEDRDALSQAIVESVDLDWPLAPPFARALLHAHARVHLAEMKQLLTGWDGVIAALEREGVTAAAVIIRPLSWDRALDKFIDAVRGYAVAASIRPTPALWGIL
jgi:hypothetical protein